MGETCAEEDVITEDCWLPKLDEGDWILFEGKAKTKQQTKNNNVFN